jgi:hypothetical protein
MIPIAPFRWPGASPLPTERIARVNVLSQDNGPRSTSFEWGALTSPSRATSPITGCLDVAVISSGPRDHALARRTRPASSPIRPRANFLDDGAVTGDHHTVRSVRQSTPHAACSPTPSSRACSDSRDGDHTMVSSSPGTVVPGSQMRPTGVLQAPHPANANDAMKMKTRTGAEQSGALARGFVPMVVA